MKDKEEADTMNAIARRIASTPAADVETMALRISREAPTLASLDPQQLEQIARLVMTQRLTRELDTAAEIAGVSWAGSKETFLGDLKSTHTVRAYSAALAALETWASREGVNPLTMTAMQADQFIRYLKEQGRASSSVRLGVAGVSAFFSFMERYHKAIKNPIRGTRIRPAKRNKKETVIPGVRELKIILANVPAVEKAIIITLAHRGLRAGVLPELVRKGGKYYGDSKGKELKENNVSGITLPPESLAAIEAAALDLKAPFAMNKDGNPMTGNAIERRINYWMDKLHKAGKIPAVYSCHDFRHFFAVREYEKHHDIFRLSKLLNHSNIAITQTYLQGLGVEL